MATSERLPRGPSLSSGQFGSYQRGPPQSTSHSARVAKAVSLSLGYYVEHVIADLSHFLVPGLLLHALASLLSCGRGILGDCALAGGNEFLLAACHATNTLIEGHFRQCGRN